MNDTSQTEVGAAVSSMKTHVYFEVCAGIVARRSRSFDELVRHKQIHEVKTKTLRN
jgi:hypothetical protein